MTLKSQHNWNQCRSIMWGVFVVFILNILASFQNQNRFHWTLEVLVKSIDITEHIYCHRVSWDKIIFQCKRLTSSLARDCLSSIWLAFNMFKIRYRYKSDYSTCNFKILGAFNEMMTSNLLKKILIYKLIK